MSRRKSESSLSRPKMPDQRFGCVVIAQFIKMLMKDGKKQKAARIVYLALEELNAYNKQHKLFTPVVNKDESDGEERESDHSGGSAEVAKVISMGNLEGAAADRALLSVFNEVLDRAGPTLELVSKRIGGANIQVPVSVRSDRRITLALRAIIRNSRARISQCKSMVAALTQEMIGVLKGSARTLDDKEQMLRMAKANAVFQGMKR